MRSAPDCSRTAALALVVLLGAVGACSRSEDTAVLEGLSSVDLVGGGESVAPDGRKDALISLRLSPGGTVTALTVHNVDGQKARWDTTPGNSFWVLGVADKDKPGELLNKADGSIEVRLDRPEELLLYLCDNGAVHDGKTRFSVTVVRSDGRQEEVAVE